MIDNVYYYVFSHEQLAFHRKQLKKALESIYRQVYLSDL